jgi:hypothetical protein
MREGLEALAVMVWTPMLVATVAVTVVPVAVCLRVEDKRWSPSLYSTLMTSFVERKRAV